MHTSRPADVGTQLVQKSDPAPLFSCDLCTSIPKREQSSKRWAELLTECSEPCSQTVSAVAPQREADTDDGSAQRVCTTRLPRQRATGLAACRHALHSSVAAWHAHPLAAIPGVAIALPAFGDFSAKIRWVASCRGMCVMEGTSGGMPSRSVHKHCPSFFRNERHKCREIRQERQGHCVASPSLLPVGGPFQGAPMRCRDAELKSRPQVL